MAKARRPSVVRVHPMRARVVRGPHKDGSGRWYWRVQHSHDATTETVWTGWATRDEVADRMVALINAPAPAPAQKDAEEITTVRDLLEVWVGHEDDRADTSRHWKRNARCCAAHVAATVGAARLDRVTSATLERHRDGRLRSGAAPSTVRQELKAFRAAWRWGREIGLCPDRSLPRMRLKVEPVRDRYTPSRDEVVQVIGALTGWPQLAVWLLYATGARVGEVAGLTPDDVDLTRATVTLRGKTGTRTVPLAADVVSALRAWTPPERAATVLGVSPKVVTGHLGSVHLRRACAAVGVKRFSPHGLRRAAVDAFLRAGVDPGTAAAFLGHSPQVMLAHYRRATAEDQRRALLAAGLGSLDGGGLVPFTPRGQSEHKKWAQPEKRSTKKPPESRDSGGKWYSQG